MVTVVFFGQQRLVDFEHNPVKQGPIDAFGHRISRSHSL
jgi:hypothetical protein